MGEVKLTCKEALQLVLDCVDYTKNACRLNDMVGAVLDRRVIELAQNALKIDTIQSEISSGSER